MKEGLDPSSRFTPPTLQHYSFEWVSSIYSSETMTGVLKFFKTLNLPFLNLFTYLISFYFCDKGQVPCVKFMLHINGFSRMLHLLAIFLL